MKKVVILVSGRGSNMRAILEAHLPLEVAAVISNELHAIGVATAQHCGIPTRVIEHRAYQDRATFETALAQTLDSFTPDLIVLAGFMRILSADFVRRYATRIINIHPSLLPALPGLHTHRAALAAGLKIHGCTVHFVTPEVDFGPIIMQAAVPVLANDSEHTLAARVLEQEHRIYPQVVRWFCENRVVLSSTGTVLIKDAPAPHGSLLSPALES